MNYVIKNSILLIIFLIISCIICTTILLLPALNHYFDLSDKGNLGSAISGLTAPVIGIASSILLYRTLMLQIENNKTQAVRNDTDIIFGLMKNLTDDINMFYTKYTLENHNITSGKLNGNKEVKFTGVEGLYDFSWRFVNNDVFKSWTFGFKSFYEAGLIELIISSFKLVESRIQLAEVPQDQLILFKRRLQSIFDSILYEPLKNIDDAIIANSLLRDELTEEIHDFLKSHAKASYKE